MMHINDSYDAGQCWVNQKINCTLIRKRPESWTKKNQSRKFRLVFMMTVVNLAIWTAWQD